ncbi:hypothetical protein DL93DRAFT_1172533 [Clavulina sp. PMI_390]|nr:hypothetical protein DL93DRAFT_1172533 [Clavulina sp. PMI_390]
MTSTATENWAHYEAPRTHARDERWDLSELFHNPVAQPHQPFTAPHHGSFHESDGYDQNSSYIPHVKSEYVEHSYDLFSSAQPAFGAAGARAAFQESPASSSSGSSRSPTYELVSGLNSVPEDGIPQAYAGQTIAPNALGSNPTHPLPPCPPFASSAMYPSPRQGMPPQHLSRPQQPHDHLQAPQHYQAAIPRQFDSHPSAFTPGMETMNNVFDHRFHLGANGHPSEPDRRPHTTADYGASSPAGCVTCQPSISDRFVRPCPFTFNSPDFP